MDKLALDTARALINFAGDNVLAAGLAEQQLVGAVALHNMLAEHQMAYLADEVGMGKTYIALGVVALMRRFQPGLRVLYLLPKNNVRDNWRRDYRSFIDKNYRLQDGIVKGLGNTPAAPYRRCKSLGDMMQAVATDSVRDFFICSSAFSLPMGTERKQLADTLAHFSSELPQSALQVQQLEAQLASLPDNADALDKFKQTVKQTWAGALNAMLPQFDLVVVDEAHNYRHGRESADRNRLIATVLGTGEQPSGLQSKARRVLLLSATPYDRDIGQLRRQLALFAKEHLLDVRAPGKWPEEHAALAPFMVRRLNKLMLAGKPHSRNMYRHEHRSGPGAEIALGLKQQLFAALLQKKVSESLNENHSGKFELGMLASLESYLPAQKTIPVEFDGLDALDSEARKRGLDAPDRNAVQLLVDSYKQHFHEFPPHPKMDQVASQVCNKALGENKKQLIFVRRVASVGELKAKIEDAYNRWLQPFLANDAPVHALFDSYLQQIAERQHARIDDEELGEQGSLSSFFAWFYRGDNQQAAAAVDQLGTTPSNYRTMLASTSIMFACNWSTLPGMPDPGTLDFDGIGMLAPLPRSATRAQQFEHAQHAYLLAAVRHGSRVQSIVAGRILALNEAGPVPVGQPGVDVLAVRKALAWGTLWETLRAHAALQCVAPDWDASVFDLLAVPDAHRAQRHLRQILMHQHLVAAVCRLDHPFIDLYSLRGHRERNDRSDSSSADERLITAFAGLLGQQSAQPYAFSSFTILRDVHAHLTLLLKQNFEDAAGMKIADLSTYFKDRLQPLSPVLGATGENPKSRSAIARKFRMPGYPRALISTDVFQEGENLHTFCDSVIHYGISASPVALEQKAGRVDRIASLSHRAMAAHQQQADAHFIQVSFPHIRESLELMQVRLAARNLNRFLLSLNKVGEAAPAAQTQVALESELRNSSPVEPLIGQLLESPFEVTPAFLQGRNREMQIAREKCRYQNQIVHARHVIESTLSQETGNAVSLCEADASLSWKAPDGSTVVLRGARGRPYLLLSVTQALIEPLRSSGQPGLPQTLDDLRTLQEDVFCRVQLCTEPDAQGQPQLLLRNAEILAGGGGRNSLSHGEVVDVYRRAGQRGVLAGAPAPLPALAYMLEQLCRQYDSYSVRRVAAHSIEYYFEIEQRRQLVHWRIEGAYLLLTARVLDSEQSAQLLADGQHARMHTLRRNARFDLVDFHIDQSLALAVRALHPLADLDLDELGFAASLVAIEADRLRQILFADPDADSTGEEPQVEPAARPDLGLRAWAEENGALCYMRSALAAGPLRERQLVQQLAYSLGYQRAAAAISLALPGVLRSASRRGMIVRRGGIAELAKKTIADYEPDELSRQFLLALGKLGPGWVERPAAIRAFARSMGFARTGALIEESAIGVIRKLLREKVLRKQGTAIRRA